MSDAHETKAVDQLAVIRGMLSEMSSKTDARLQAIDAKVDASRAEAAHRGAEQSAFNVRIEANVATLGNEVKRLSGRVHEVEQDIRELREEDAKVLRHASETDLEHEAALGGAIAHVTKLEASIGGVVDRIEAQDRVQKEICRVVGVDYDDASDPNTPPVAKPKADLVQMARENKAGTVAALLAFLTAAIQLAIHLLGKV